MEAKPLILERTYNAPIEKVWAAITDRKQMKEWYFELDEFKAEKGFKFQFTGGDEKVQYLHECEILESDPPRKLSYSWTYPEYKGYSVLTWELFSEGEKKTRLRLTHQGLESFPQENPNFRVESFSGGWNYFVNEALPKFVETETISRHISIHALSEVIWNILLNPGGQWGKAFGENAIAKSDWNPGSNVVWTDETGDICAFGIVAEHRPGEYLQVDMYDDIDPAPGTQTGAYSEKYKLTKTNDENYVLSIEAGPLAKKDIQQHAAMWDQAVEIIRDLAEKR
ncbi:SRPBCC family protein [Dyadobacter aurulentus]|uniref:SRPBCC family protein n=1 Tax=Dyadobacter sp. UC 10 TaxID=2605428 RepID=UPI0011F0B2D8|nr:SRPBCC domain-containing protein [Dyadobacter sp. UC 10]KAA0988931.1 SRPBCC domain-containing protein [Dyadobacter sp. UC 10]